MLSRIQGRHKSREKINEYTQQVDESTVFMTSLFTIEVLLLISQSVDDYLEHRITADKTIEGILKDIQANTAAEK